MPFKQSVRCVCQIGMYVSLAVVGTTSGYGQVSLSLGSAAGQPGASVSIPLTFAPNGTQASSVQWTLAYSPNDVTAVTVAAGSAASTAGKGISCNAIVNGQYKCIASGSNATILSAGALATVRVTLASTTAATSTPIQVTNPQGASGGGDAITASATGGTVSIVRPVAISGLSCSPTTVIAPASTKCTVTLSAAALATGFPVSLGYSVLGATVSTPSSITIPSGATSGAFTVQVQSALSAALLQITATGAGTTRTASLSIAVPPVTGDRTAPVISSLVVRASSTSAILSWATNEAASSRVEYGLSASSLTSVATSASLVTSRSLTLSGLQAATTYYYRVISKDAAGNTATTPATGTSTFKTTAVQAAPGVDSSGLFAFWPFEETGPEALDQVGRMRPAYIYGAARTAGRTGKALNFDGINNYVSVSAFDMPGSAMSISSWFKADALPNVDPRIISKASGSAEQDHYFMLGTTEVSGLKRLRFRLKTAGTTRTLIASSGNLPIGQWVHAVATYDGATMRLYLNGALVGSQAASGAMTGNMNAPVAIGRNPGSAYGPFDGIIDQVRLYTRALSPTDITALYQSGQ